MKRPAAFAFLLSCVVCASQAQNAAATDPVVTHFREYRAALDRNDLPAAEAAATAAWQASESTQGRRTAVLAFNLATLRLGMSDPARALEPATRAHDLAASSDDSGVDPLHASLVLGRAELAADERAGAERLRSAIAAAEAAGTLLAEAHDAAVTLGDWALNEEAAPMAQAAWAAAGRLAEHASGAADFNKGRARLMEGVAIFIGGIDRKNTRAVGTAASAAAHEAFYAFSDAMVLFRPYAYPEPTGESLTLAQTAFAQALGWRQALLAKLQSQEEVLQLSPERQAQGVDETAGEYCMLRSIPVPQPKYPREMISKGGVGAVVVHVALDAEGNILKRQIAAAVPTGPLRAAVEAVFSQWRFERHPSSAPGCRNRSSNYMVMNFVLE
jgi:TonB family protein